VRVWLCSACSVGVSVGFCVSFSVHVVIRVRLCSSSCAGASVCLYVLQRVNMCLRV
jgi:hypothetical protein